MSAVWFPFVSPNAVRLRWTSQLVTPWLDSRSALVASRIGRIRKDYSGCQTQEIWCAKGQFTLGVEKSKPHLPLLCQITMLECDFGHGNSVVLYLMEL
ncbi:hypothetical protein SRHO_G00008590 [Serrasalmus rhombeus]